MGLRGWSRADLRLAYHGFETTNLGAQIQERQKKKN